MPQITGRYSNALPPLGFAAATLAFTLATPFVRADESPDSLEATVKSHMEFLASDALNGRGSGTRDEWIAATYIAAEARRYGLQSVGSAADLVEAVDIDSQVAVAPVLIAGSVQYQHGAQMLVRSMALPKIEGSLQKFIVGQPVRPGAVLLLPHQTPVELPPDADRAALLLIPENPKLRSHWSELGERELLVGGPRLGGVPRANAGSTVASRVVLSDESYTAVARLPEESPVSLRTEIRESLRHTWNVVALLPGTDPVQRDSMVLLTAHLDHLGAHGNGPDIIYNGADDDASGTSAVLALAEMLAKGPRLKRTLVFAWFGSEEIGGYGAQYFVQKPVIPLQSIVANLEFEMIGRPDGSIAPHTLWLTGWERSNLGPELARHGARLVADPHPDQNFFQRSDNITLARLGVVAQTVSSFGLHADYHQPSDELSRIDFKHMTESIRSMLAPIRWLADGSFKPEWQANGRPQ
jgi:aminopeptidase YwaD